MRNGQGTGPVGSHLTYGQGVWRLEGRLEGEGAFTCQAGHGMHCSRARVGTIRGAVTRLAQLVKKLRHATVFEQQKTEGFVRGFD